MPPLPVECLDIDGDWNSLPIIFEDRYVESPQTGNSTQKWIKLHLNFAQIKITFFLLDWLSQVPTTEGQTNQENAVRPAFGIFERRQGASSPAIPELDALDDCIDLPTYVSLIAEQSNSSTSVRVPQSLIPAENSVPSPCLEEGVEELQEEQQEEKNAFVEACEVASEELLSKHSTQQLKAEGTDSSGQEKGNCLEPCEGQLESNTRESEEDREESDVAMPLNHTTVDESDDVPQINLLTANQQLPTPSFVVDPRKELIHRGCLVTSKIMKRSSSVISDSGIESEPSSVAWPLDAALRGRPLRDFSSDREIPQQMVCGLQMESNGSLPSAGIQASLTSISSLPYEEDQQQRRLSKLTKSVSAPQISSPDDMEEDFAKLTQQTDPKNSVQHGSAQQKLDFEQPESYIVDPNSTSHANFLRESIIPEYSTLPELNTSEVSHLQEALGSPTGASSSVASNQGQKVNLAADTGEESASVEDVLLVEAEAATDSRGSEHKKTTDVKGGRTGGPGQSLLMDHEEVDLCQAQLVSSSPQHQSERVNNAAQRPSELTGLLVNDMTSTVDFNGTADGDKEPLGGQAKPSKIPNSGLAFVNKKMVEVVNMSVSCAPTCLPFSSVLRDSPSVSGMSPRQTTSPITHQPLGSFGLVSSSSLNVLTMDEETNERMLK